MNDKLKDFYNQHSERQSANLRLDDTTKERLKNDIFSKLGTVVDQSPASISTMGKLRIMFVRSYILAPLIIILFVAGTTYASANSLPGDALYPVKRQVEKTQLLIAPTEEAKLELQEKFAQKRLEEYEQIQKTQDADDVTNKELRKEKNDDNKDNHTVINIDGSAVSSERKETKHWERQDNAREEANKALESLQKTRDNWQRKGNNERADELERKVNEYRQQLENRWDKRGDSDSEWHRSEDSGEVRGATDEGQRKVNNWLGR